MGVGVAVGPVLTCGAVDAGGVGTAAGFGGSGVAPVAATVVDSPLATVTDAPPALVSTVPSRVMTVVSPPGATDTTEPEPARMTDAIAALRTSYRPADPTVRVTAYHTRPRVCCIRTA